MTSAVSSMIAAERAAFAALVLLGSLAVAPGVARADAPPPDGARADALFREGRMLLDAKRYDEACPKLAASQQQEPGAGTLVALALCHEGQGKTASAWTELNEAAALGKRVGRDDLASAAQKRAAAMEPLLARVLVRGPRGEGVAYDVTCDGEPIDARRLAAPIPVDPGDHRCDVSASGKVARSYFVRATAGATVEIVVDTLESAPGAAKIDLVTPPPSVRGEERGGGAQRTIGLVVVGLGVAGLGAGAYFGGRGLSQSSDGGGACKSSPCPPDANDANVRARSSFAMALASVAAGTGAIALGAVIYVTAPSASTRGSAPSAGMTARIAPEVGPTQASIGVTGSF